MLSTPLYLGIDLGKQSHAVALISEALLASHKQRYEKCPVKKIENNRVGFERLLSIIKQYTEPAQCHILLERTGHYGLALEQFLTELDCKLYRIRAQGRYGDDKTDQKDAQALAVRLYTQIALAAPVVNEKDRVSRLVPPTPIAVKLGGLARHHYEVIKETTRRKNKLTAICDVLFPELTQIYKNPNLPSALALRSAFPTPQAIMEASLDELCATRLYRLPSRESIASLQALAASTIGTKDKDRQFSLLIEQKHLINELKTLNTELLELESEIEAIIQTSREGRIIDSFIGCSPVQAATLLAGIGNIANFKSVGALRKYCGWAPKRSQTGTTFDTVTLGKGGNKLLKRTISLIVASAVRYDPTWRTLYKRLEQRLCSYDARTKRYKGKGKVIGHIAGQMIKVMYILLRRDDTLVKKHKAGEELPEPELYDPGKHLVIGLQVEQEGVDPHQLTPANTR